MNSSNLKSITTDAKRGVYFIGTTPPKQDTDLELVSGIADKLLGRLEEIDYDGLIVYDIQDETSRTNKPRPFPIVLVGSPSSAGEIKLSLADAYKTLESHPQDFYLGGVTIAERHVAKGDEHMRLCHKKEQGCEYFITQAVYNAQATIDLLTRYAIECKQRGVQPKRIILTFSPCGSAKTLEFIEWLGISVPEATSLRILESENPLKESLQISRNNFEQILQAVLPLNIPLGLNIESLTNRKEEIDAAILLFKLLKATLDLKLAESQL